MNKLLPAPDIGAAFSIRRWLKLNLVLLALVGLLSMSFPVESLNRRFEDFYFRLRGDLPTSADVAMVLIDDSALARYGRWPWHRHRLAQLIRAITRVHPRAIGIDILMSEPEDDANDSDLAEAIQASHNVVLASKISSSLDRNLWVDPLPRFATAAAAVGHVQAILDPDGRCRRIPVVEPSAEGPRFAFAIKLAEVARPELARREAEVQDSSSAIAGVDQIVSHDFSINYRNQLTPGQPSPPFAAVSAGDLLDGKTEEELRNKVILVGFGATEISDRLFTPVSNASPMPGVEVSANAVETVLSGQEIQTLWPAAQLLLLLVTSMLILWMVLRWPGGRGLFCLAAALLGIYVGGFLLFVRLNLMLHYGSLLLAGVLAAPLAQLENLIVVDGAVTGRLKDLQKLLNGAHSKLTLNGRAVSTGDAPPSSLHWKLKALTRLQGELISLYAFDQTLIETMQEALAVFAFDGRLLFHNSSWQRFCEKQGIPAKSSLRDFTVSLGGWQELFEMAPRFGAWLEKEISLSKGLWRIRGVRLPWTTHAESGAIMLLIEDVSARGERDQARAEALSFVTHELRTPLIAIQGFAEFLMRYPQQSAGSQAPATIFREARRLVAMINAYLEVLRLDVGSRPLRVKPVDVTEMVNHVEQILQPLAQAARIHLKVEIDSAVGSIECDEPLISGALLNLLSNAVKYSPAGSEVRLRVFSADHEVDFEVHNTGPVIPREELDHLFEPFYRVSEQADSKPGWGLGLAFVKRISQQHGGRVEVRSTAASGTCFRFTLPISSRVISEALA